MASTDSKAAQEQCPDFEGQIEKELNTISWTQIPATDLDRVKKFYKTIFGWAYDDLSVEQSIADAVQESAYKDLSMTPTDVMFSMIRFSESEPIPHGGFVKVSEANLLSPALHPDNAQKARLSVCSTITVRSIDETLPKIVQAGGKVYEEKKMIPGGMGATALFLDTENNVMGLWSMK